MSRGAVAEEVARFLGLLSGVRSAAPLPSSAVPQALAAEERYEREAALPLENSGVRAVLARQHVVVLLKDPGFRRPPGATLYLVEEGEAPSTEELVVEGKRFHVLGEEIVAEGQEPASGGVAISAGFYLYPERRTDAALPSRFLLPPVPFPELLREPWRGCVGAVVSASPSPLCDLFLRGCCGFPDDPVLATLLVGFDPAAAIGSR